MSSKSAAEWQEDIEYMKKRRTEITGRLDQLPGKREAMVLAAVNQSDAESRSALNALTTERNDLIIARGEIDEALPLAERAAAAARDHEAAERHKRLTEELARLANRRGQAADGLDAALADLKAAMDAYHKAANDHFLAMSDIHGAKAAQDYAPLKPAKLERALLHHGLVGTLVETDQRTMGYQATTVALMDKVM